MGFKFEGFCSFVNVDFNASFFLMRSGKNCVFRVRIESNKTFRIWTSVNGVDQSQVIKVIDKSSGLEDNHNSKEVR